ncbi:putative ribonuclease H-like domain-containing protein [Tanacetum coccineum]|uniref:Ribonuclease H-like domain-containing protein n=1 Tax=Tanacetum coccineum TaxID=301880 RepID=A0ABQ4X4D6_9ASTR
MDDFCREKGIKREYSVARTPQQNGVAERRNRTLIEAARTMLADSKLPTTFWAEAVSTACYVQNRVLVVKPHNKTPYELFRGFKPALSFMRPFGCHVTILNTLDSLGKFDGKSDEDVDNGEPKTANDAQKQVKDGPNNKNDEQEWFANDSSTKDVNADRKQVNTASPDVNTGSLTLNAVGPSVSTASPNEQDSTKEEPKVDLRNITNSYIVPTTPNTRIYKDHPIDNVIDEVQSTVQIRRMSKPTSEQGLNQQALLKLYLIHPRWKQYKKNFCNSNFNKFGYWWISLMERRPLEQNRQEEGIDYEEVFAPVAIIEADILLVHVYVDDIIFDSTNKKLCTRFEKLMKDKFQMSSMGELTFFLRLQVQQKEDGIFISQDKYVAEILKKFNYSDVNSASTPVDLEKPLVKDGDADEVDIHLYRSMIGSLMYLTTSRLDIMFAVCACARFHVTPKTSHLLAVKRIFRYLKGKPTLGLWLISWQCKKQTVVATSTTKAEYTAATNCCGQVRI